MGSNDDKNVACDATTFEAFRSRMVGAGHAHGRSAAEGGFATFLTVLVANSVK